MIAQVCIHFSRRKSPSNTCMSTSSSLYDSRRNERDHIFTKTPSSTFLCLFQLVTFTNGMSPCPFFPQFSKTTDESCSHLQSILHMKVQHSFDSVMMVDEEFRWKSGCPQWENTANSCDCWSLWQSPRRSSDSHIPQVNKKSRRSSSLSGDTPVTFQTAV